MREWRTLDELFPLLKYDSSGSTAGVRPASRGRFKTAFDGSDDSGDQRSISSALKAGWICFGIGLATSWFFPLGHAFFSVAIITAVVAMCTHQVNRGLALLVSSFVAIALCTAVFFALVGIAAAPAIRQADADLRKMEAAQTAALNQITQTTAQLQSNLTAIATQPVLPASSSTPSARFVGNATFNQHRQHELAMAQQRQADAQKAADDRQRQQAVREAERQRDRANAKEQDRQRLQSSVDWWDQQVKQARLRGCDFRWLETQREDAWRRKQEFERQ